MNSCDPIIFDIKRDCSEDGPGIRTTVFFQGCPLHCAWCHNPEGIPIKNAGTKIPLPELINRVLIDQPFFKVSGGGITLSGGEATRQTEAASQFLLQLKENNIHTALETSGCFQLQPFVQKMLPLLDLILFDLKIFSEIESRKYVGLKSGMIKENFTALYNQYAPKIRVRLPVIPGYTANRENFISWAQFLNHLKVDFCELLPFNPLGSDKSPRQSPRIDTSHCFMPLQELREYQMIFNNHFVGKVKIRY